jgi:hypothetical protein
MLMYEKARQRERFFKAKAFSDRQAVLRACDAVIKAVHEGKPKDEIEDLLSIQRALVSRKLKN